MRAKQFRIDGCRAASPGSPPPVLDTDEMFSHTFDAAGPYKYYCSIHPRMTGQVVVR
jgi:plastocyanin